MTPGLAKFVAGEIHPAVHFEPVDLTRVNTALHIDTPAKNLSAHFSRLDSPLRRQEPAVISKPVDAASLTRAQLQQLDPTTTPLKVFTNGIARHGYDLNTPSTSGLGDVLESVAFMFVAPKVRELSHHTGHQEKLLSRHNVIVQTAQDPAKLAGLAKQGAINLLASATEAWASQWQPQAKLVNWLAHGDVSSDVRKALGSAQAEVRNTLAAQKRFVQALRNGNLEAWDHASLLVVGIGSLALNPNRAAVATKLDKARKAEFYKNLDPRARNFKKTMREEGWGIFYSGDLISVADAAYLTEYLKRTNSVLSGQVRYVDGIGFNGRAAELKLDDRSRSIAMNWFNGTLEKATKAYPNEHPIADSLIIARNWRAQGHPLFGAHVDPGVHWLAMVEFGDVHFPTVLYPGAKPLVTAKRLSHNVSYYENSKLGVKPVTSPPGGTTMWSGAERLGELATYHSTHPEFLTRITDGQDRYSFFMHMGPPLR